MEDNSHIVGGVAVNSTNYKKCLEITDNINRLLRMVAHDSGGSSTHRRIYEHASFKELVEMGDKIIPYLFHLITHYGGSWTILLLLSEIAPEDPIQKDHAGKFIHLMIDWLQWYVESKYYKEINDVYYGLIEKHSPTKP